MIQYLYESFQEGLRELHARGERLILESVDIDEERFMDITAERVNHRSDEQGILHLGD